MLSTTLEAAWFRCNSQCDGDVADTSLGSEGTKAVLVRVYDIVSRDLNVRASDRCICEKPVHTSAMSGLTLPRWYSKLRKASPTSPIWPALWNYGKAAD